MCSVIMIYLLTYNKYIEHMSIYVEDCCLLFEFVLVRLYNSGLVRIVHSEGPGKFLEVV